MPTRDHSSVTVCGREVKLAYGDVDQTVNICRTSNAEGDYEWTYVLPAIPRLGAGTIVLRDFASLEAFRTFLGDECHGKLRPPRKR